MHMRLRFILGVTLAVIAAIVLLKYADTQLPTAQPSHLYEGNNPESFKSFDWWMAAGGVLGVVVGLAVIRVENQMQQGVGMIVTANVLVSAILAYLDFDGYAITPMLYAQVAAIQILVFTLIATLPALAGLILVSMLTSRPPKRSALDIMPDELRDQFLAEANQPKKQSFLHWPPRHKEHATK